MWNKKGLTFKVYRMEIVSHVKRLLFLFFVLATCPLAGQVKNHLQAELENGQLYLTVDEAFLGTPFMLVRHGTGFHQVVWSKQEGLLSLTITDVKSLAGIRIPVNLNPNIQAEIIGRFPIIPNGVGGSYKVNITGLFVSTSIAWGAKTVDSIREEFSFIDDIRQMDREIVVRTKLTGTYKGKLRTQEVIFSFFELPEPMAPRSFDHRMAFSAEEDFSPLHHQYRSGTGNIRRWRLEKRSMRGDSKVIKPIIFYIHPEIPKKWWPYIKAGVLEWSPAFEAIGLKDALVVKEFTGSIDEGLLRSMTYSMIRFDEEAGVRGADDWSGTTEVVSDYRSGEILKADIILGSMTQRRLVKYMVRCGALDKRVLEYPIPKDLEGELIQSLIAHETGHALGLRDGHHGEYAYPFEKMRDKAWLDSMGHTPSVMNYTRHHYLPQPEDGVPPSLLIQRVGPMDYHQIQWGYSPLPKNRSVLEERSVLDSLVREQDTKPWLRYSSTRYGSIGPGQDNEVADNDDPIASARLGMKNLERVLKLFSEINRTRRDNQLLEELHAEAMNFWYQQMTHVVSMIGGVSVQYQSGDQPNPKYIPVPKKAQEEALEFLLSNAFQGPDWLSNPAYLGNIAKSSDDKLLLHYQIRLLSDIIDAARMKRIEQMEELPGYNDIFESLWSQLASGLFGELKQDKSSIPVYRQELQQAYISLSTEAISLQRNYRSMEANHRMFSNYSKNVLMSQLLWISERIRDNIGTMTNKTSKAHLKLCLRKIDKVS